MPPTATRARPAGSGRAGHKRSGAANALAATGEALASGSPVLVIATDIPAGLRRSGIYRGVLHETCDQTAMFAPVTRSATLLEDADAIGSAVLAAGRGRWRRRVVRCTRESRPSCSPHGPQRRDPLVMPARRLMPWPLTALLEAATRRLCTSRVTGFGPEFEAALEAALGAQGRICSSWTPG